jgi:hypothetical protein
VLFRLYTITRLSDSRAFWSSYQALRFFARVQSLFPRGLAPREQAKRLQLLAPLTGAACELLDELDAQLYREVFPTECEGRESLDDLLAAFMRQRASEPVIV